MKCSEVMKAEVECCSYDENVELAAERMQRRNVGFLPVCDDEMKVIGTVTDRDLALRVLADGRVPSQTTVEDVMSAELVCCAPDDDLDRAEALMAEHRKSRIVCTDQRGRPVGVISLSDIVQVEDPAKLSKVLGSIASREAQPARL